MVPSSPWRDSRTGSRGFQASRQSRGKDATSGCYRADVTVEHFGIYGAWLQFGRLVTVRKSRGPYAGWLDLPGGTPEPEEDEEVTLCRELREECGVTPLRVVSWNPFDVLVTEASDGLTIDFRHRGLVALVTVDIAAKSIEMVEDVARVEFMDRDQPAGVTPAVHLAWNLLAP